MTTKLITTTTLWPSWHQILPTPVSLEYSYQQRCPFRRLGSHVARPSRWHYLPGRDTGHTSSARSDIPSTTAVICNTPSGSQGDWRLTHAESPRRSVTDDCREHSTCITWQDNAIKITPVIAHYDSCDFDLFLSTSPESSVHTQSIIHRN